ncbi:MAG: hypothetical protein M3Q34_04655 [bacterium]|nr:hypothetical protein [bacterium]
MNSFTKHYPSKKLLSIVCVVAVVFLLSMAYVNNVFGSVFDTMSGAAWQADNFNDLNGNGIQDPWLDLNNNGIQDTGEDQAEIANPAGGMGWLSFNCTTDLPNTCGTSNYGVNLDINTGVVAGYAWSANYGWLKFGGLAGQIIDPSRPNDVPPYVGQNIVATDAFVDLNSGTPTARPVSGWARFCSAAANPANCLGATIPNMSNGGWDGWVNLSGSNYNVTFNEVTREFAGFAWGGDDHGANFVGWVSFNCLNTNNCAISDYKVIYSPLTGPLVTLQANPVVIPVQGKTNLHWEGTDLLGGNTCVGTHTGPDVPGWDEPHPSPIGDFLTPALQAGSYEFTITCEGSNGDTATASVTVNVGIQIQLDADPAVVLPPSYITKLYWNAIPNTPNGILKSCVTSSVPPVATWDNFTVADMPPAGELSNVPVPASPTKFTINCKDSLDNNVTKSVFVNRGTLPELLTLKNSPVTESPAGSGAYTTTLTWKTVNIKQNSCVASGDGGWSGNKDNPQNGSNSESDVKVPTIPPPPVLFEYRITCIGLYSGQPVSVSLFLNSGSDGNFSTKRPKYIEF